MRCRRRPQSEPLGPLQFLNVGGSGVTTSSWSASGGPSNTKRSICGPTYASVSEARAGIGLYLGFYNSRRPHSSLDGRTPDQAYFNPPTPEAAAA